MDGRTQRVPGVHREVLREGEDLLFRTGVPAFVGYAGVVAPPVVLTRWAQFGARVRGVPDRSLLAPAVRGFFAAGGHRCVVLTTSEARGVAGLGEALDGLDAVGDVDLVSAPDLLTGAGPDASAERVAAQVELVRRCGGPRRCMVLIDAPAGLVAAEAHATALRAAIVATDPALLRDAALYFPWVRAAGERRFVPPSGHIAGTIAGLDAREGVQRAPAGVVLAGVCDLSDAVDDDAQLRLDAVGVNCIRAFRGRGLRIWGTRTLSDERDWRALSVRRLLQTMARWLELRLADFAFEPNNGVVWNRLAREVGDYCERLHAAGALKGRIPAEAYYVKCDAETNPPEIRDAGMLVAEIGVAPLAPQEFIALRLIQRGEGTSLTDAEAG
jgi:phage tail sheath protein FI